jgi:hypothetical protein
MDPNRPTFESVVDKVTHNSKMAAGTKSFKSIAKSVLREDQEEQLIMGQMGWNSCGFFKGKRP